MDSWDHKISEHLNFIYRERATEHYAVLAVLPYRRGSLIATRNPPIGEFDPIVTQLGIRQSIDKEGKPIFRITLSDHHEKENGEAQYHALSNTWSIIPRQPNASSQLRDDLSQDPSNSSETLPQTSDAEETRARKLKPTEKSTLEPSEHWLDHLVPRTEHIDFFLKSDWSSTPLGPLGTWSTLLRLMTYEVFSDPRAACLYW